MRRRASRELPNPELPDRQRALVVSLNADDAGSCQAEIGVAREFARGDPGFPVRAPQLVLDDLPAIEPMLDMRAVDDQSTPIPLIEWQDDSGRNAIERIRGRGGGGTLEAVVTIRV